MYFNHVKYSWKNELLKYSNIFSISIFLVVGHGVKYRFNSTRLDKKKLKHTLFFSFNHTQKGILNIFSKEVI